MAKITPFKAVRPTRDKVSLVTSRSYEEYSAAELASQLDFNPLSFLHVLNPAYTNQQKNTFEKRFKQVSQKYQEFKEEHILAQDQKPSIYLHKIITKTHKFIGIIVGTSVEDYKNNIIKKHEDTIEYRVDLFKDYIKYAGFNTEPVLMTYPDNLAIERWILQKKQAVPDFEFSATNKDIHYLWKIDNETEIQWLQKTFEEIGDLYIADGHHRSASAALLYEQEKQSGNDNLKFFMSFLIAESNVKIYEYNRLIKDLNGLIKVEFLKKLQEHFFVEIKQEKLFQPAEKHIFGMYLDGEFYSLSLKSDKKRATTVLNDLDAQILYDYVLLPILGIEDLRNDERIEYIPGKQSVLDVKAKVDSEEFEVGFILFPSNINEIKKVADANLIMPPKSTYIEPKFRSGLVVYEL
ncbi:DUF1015 domain-containing protein [Flavobacterium sp. GT3R68]|uniref:DUF1015 domain-containing protein n=1 Tax=Flavobacterium sp. GT3R68 TaxID=2594437 RepID=UPI000F88763D|nr:DUF1015 domain-containing protein [Flavobacterium sp. GT3R68]RTY95074.1 DUF1015 domain-containing protein [Flavobacterium sp. GSN2]TRW91880.1 DUF1015 domain-containing protein [Flavobacterium sp. GT3R68]